MWCCGVWVQPTLIILQTVNRTSEFDLNFIGGWLRSLGVASSITVYLSQSFSASFICSRIWQLCPSQSLLPYFTRRWTWLITRLASGLAPFIINPPLPSLAKSCITLSRRYPWITASLWSVTSVVRLPGEYVWLSTFWWRIWLANPGMWCPRWIGE